MTAMFYGCGGLTSLDISSFDTSNVTNMHSMFRGCHGLTTIYVSNKWDASNVTSDSYMFYDCTKLVGGYGTSYNSAYVGATRAVIDSSTTPGYLTDLGELTQYADHLDQ
jgi:surface protein